MPKHSGVYRSRNGTWYFKARSHIDPATGQWKQVTRRGYATAADASLARQKALSEFAALRRDPRSVDHQELTVGGLLEMYLAEAEAMNRLAAKTLFDYRNYVDSYIVPHLGDVNVHKLTAQRITQWQLDLARSGARKSGRGLSSNTIRLARAPLNAAYKYATAHGITRSNPLLLSRPPAKVRSTPAHWTPEQARTFLAWQEGDRLWPLWAFLLGSGLRIGELVWLRWPQVDLDRQHVRISEFAATLGYELVPSTGKSRDATRTIDLDRRLVDVLRRQQRRQADELAQAMDYAVTDYVFTKQLGGAYHPQTISKLLARLSVEVGLPRLTAHGLRHTSATLMLASGVPPKVAAERLGHADTLLFSNLYSHVTSTMQRDAAARLGEALLGSG